MRVRLADTLHRWSRAALDLAQIVVRDPNVSAGTALIAACPLIWAGSEATAAIAALLSAICFRVLVSTSESYAGRGLSSGEQNRPAISHAPLIEAFTLLVALACAMTVLRGTDGALAAATSSLLLSQGLLLVTDARHDVAKLCLVHLTAALASCIALGPGSILAVVAAQNVWLLVDSLRFGLAGFARLTSRPPKLAPSPKPKKEEKSPLPFAHTLGAWGTSVAIISLAIISIASHNTPSSNPNLYLGDDRARPNKEDAPREMPTTSSDVPVIFFNPANAMCALALELIPTGFFELSSPAPTVSVESENWRPVGSNLAVADLEEAAPEEATSLFGEVCDGTHLRIIQAAAVAAAPGFDGPPPETPQLLVGAVSKLRLPDGRDVFLARAASSTRSHGYLIAALPSPTGPRFWLLSDQGEDGIANAVLFAPAVQPLGGYHLWYAAMAPSGEASAATADIIDLSGSAPRNTGHVPAWAASTCGHVPGALLYPAEPDCVEHPSWAYWISELTYDANGADAVSITYHLRRQFGAEVSPATYEAAEESEMHAHFVMGSGSWRLDPTSGPLFASGALNLAAN